MLRAFRTPPWLLAVLLFPGLAAGCAATGETPEEVRENFRRIESLLDSASILLPSIPVDIGRDGRVEKIGGFPAKTVDETAQRLTGNPLVGRVVVVDAAYLRWFDRVDIQHVTVAIQPKGVFVLVNGRPLPFVAWDAESLDNGLRVLEQFQKDPSGDKIHFVTPQVFESIRALAPLIKTLNLRFDIRFPDFPDIGGVPRRPIPLPDEVAFEQALAHEEVARAPLQSVDLAVTYKPLFMAGQDVGWVPSVLGFSTVDLQRIADSLAEQSDERIKIPQMRLREDIRRRMQAANIDSVGIESRADGLFVTVGGRVLPHLAWNEATLTNLSMVIAQLYPPGLPKLPDDARWVPVVRGTAPMYNDYDLAVVVQFPVQQPSQ